MLLHLAGASWAHPWYIEGDFTQGDFDRFRRERNVDSLKVNVPELRDNIIIILALIYLMTFLLHSQEIVLYRTGHVSVGTGDPMGLGEAMRDTSFWSVAVPRAMTIYANIIFVMLWVGFVIGLIVNQGWLDVLWTSVRALPSIAEIIVWVLFLPIMVGLWIWQSSWPALVRLLGFAGIAGWTLLAVSSLYKTFR